MTIETDLWTNDGLGIRCDVNTHSLFWWPFFVPKMILNAQKFKLLNKIRGSIADLQLQINELLQLKGGEKPKQVKKK